MNTFSSLDAATVGIVLAPLIGFLINGLMGKKLSKSLIGMVGSGSVLVSFVLSCFLFVTQLSGSYESHTTTLFSWLPLGNYTVNFSFLVDPLSLLMLMVVTGVGFLIHVYSIGYMHNDEGFYKFFAYLNLFIFSMLLLVLGANFPVMFAGWEGVGLCSYLLIGFWYKNADYTAAAQKAFVMNRIGDLGFLLGIFLILNTFGTLDFADVMNNASSLSANNPTLVAITLLLFVGATGKSAQVPLFTWLPDAMAGPTPVSALIHAATMVTAGLYMIARCNVLFALAPTTLSVISVVAIITALLAATIAIFQNDIKKILAYSTVSQLGYMFLAMGLGAFGSGMFHVMTHAFFKALLFLGAGAVIHSLHGEQDIRRMGGLKDHMPLTYKIFLVGTIAIAGIPPFAGFFSKDEILLNAFMDNKILWVLGIIGSLITAGYMFRLLYLVFWGSYRGDANTLHHLHHNPNSMNYPLIVLAVLSVVGGLVGLPEFTGINAFQHFLEPVFAQSAAMQHHHHLSVAAELALMAFTVGLVLIVVYNLLTRYQSLLIGSMDTDNKNQTWWKTLFVNKYYVDEIYDAVFVRPSRALSVFFYKVVDVQIIDGIVNGIGQGTMLLSRASRDLQSGSVGGYLLWMAIGVLAIILAFLFN